jgi:type IV fimbrial biogenesis protein FimT
MNMSNTRPKAQRKQKGFTLIEMLVTVVALAIITAAALPSFRSFVTNMRIKNVSFDVMAMLTLTRSEAIKRNAKVTACPINNDWAQGWTVAPNVNQCPAVPPFIGSQAAQPVNSMAITCYQLGAVTPCVKIEYDGSGRAGNAMALQIRFLNARDSTDENSTRCISIDPSGRPNSRKGTCI